MSVVPVTKLSLIPIGKMLSRLLSIAVLLSVVFADMAARELGNQRVALLGDSNTWIGGEDCADPQGWSHWFAEEAKPLEIKSYARSGATWTHTSATRPDVETYSEVLDDNNVIFNQVLRLLADVDINGRQTPDLIIIAAGTNDAWFADRRPEEFSVTVNEALARDEQEYAAALPSAFRSLAGAVRQDLIFLRRFFPSAKIVVLTPPPSTKISPAMLEKVSEIIAGMAERMEASVVRLDLLSPINPEREAADRRYTKDGVHTSEEGARSHGLIVARAIVGTE